MDHDRSAWPFSAENERQLVDRMRAGEESAFETFAACYIPGLYRFARRRLEGNTDLAQEVVQTTVCRLIEKLDSYRGEASLFTWLCACCRNEIAGHFRIRGRRPREVELDETEGEANATNPFADPGAGFDERLIRMETAERVHAALDRLPPGYARAVEWRYLDGMDVPEIADRLEVSYKAAESLLSRARRAFKEAYEHLSRSEDTAEGADAAPQKGVAP